MIKFISLRCYLDRSLHIMIDAGEDDPAVSNRALDTVSCSTLGVYAQTAIGLPAAMIIPLTRYITTIQGAGRSDKPM